MPEIAEAQALLAALSQTDEVKAAIDARKQRVALQMAYASAHLHAGGPGAPQTTAAFARARDLAAVNEDAPERLSAYYGLWVSHFARGELAQAREVTDSMLRDFESGSGSQDYSLIHRAIGMNCYAAGQYLDARRHLEESVASYSAERDRGSSLRFGVDTGVASKCFLAMAVWPLGDFDAARRISEDAIALAQQLNHVPTLAYAHSMIAALDATRRDSSAARSHAEDALHLGREHGMPLYQAMGSFFRGWATAASGAVGERARGHAPRRRNCCANRTF